MTIAVWRNLCWVSVAAVWARLILISFFVASLSYNSSRPTLCLSTVHTERTWFTDYRRLLPQVFSHRRPSWKATTHTTWTSSIQPRRTLLKTETPDRKWISATCLASRIDERRASHLETAALLLMKPERKRRRSDDKTKKKMNGVRKKDRYHSTKNMANRRTMDILTEERLRNITSERRRSRLWLEQ